MGWTVWIRPARHLAAGDHGWVRTVGVEEELLVVDPAGRPAAARPRCPGDGRPAGRGGDRGGARPRRSAGRRGARRAPHARAQGPAARARHPGLPDACRGRCGAAPSGGGGPTRRPRPWADGSPRWPPRPWPSIRIPTAGERYDRLHDAFGLTAHEMLTCGCHVHVTISDDEEGVAVLNRIRVWLPVLTALTANSPFWQGADTGYASFRSQAWHRWPAPAPTRSSPTPPSTTGSSTPSWPPRPSSTPAWSISTPACRTSGRPSRSGPPTSPSGSRTPSRSPAWCAASSRPQPVRRGTAPRRPPSGQRSCASPPGGPDAPG